MATTQYIGARYVPLIGRKGESSAIWDNSAPYEPLTVVTYLGDSYTSRQSVPAGIAITDTDYWVKTGDYNAQVATYVQQVTNLQSNVSAVEDALPISDFDNVNTVKVAIDANATDIGALQDALPISDFDSVNTVKAALDAISGGTSVDVAELQNALPISDFSAQSTVKDAIDAISDIIPSSDFDSVNTVKKFVNTSVSAESANRINGDNALNASITTINSFLPSGYSTQIPIVPIVDYVMDQDDIVDTNITWHYRKWNSGRIEITGKYYFTKTLGMLSQIALNLPSGLIAQGSDIVGNINVFVNAANDAYVCYCSFGTNYVEAYINTPTGSGDKDAALFITLQADWK